ncbi:permease [Chloroflexota bacterium]
MSKKGRFRQMLIPTIIMGVIAIALLIYAYSKGGGEHILGLKAAGNIFLQVLPLLLFVFIIAGVIQYILPVEMVAKWVGVESGFRGIIIGTVAGGITPGGPMVSMPIAAGLLQSGAGIGTMVAFMTGWSLWAFSRIPLEIGLMGWKFTAIRLACTFFFPIIAGLLANLFFSKVNLT